MHPPGVDPRPPCSNLSSSSTAANGSGQPGEADSEVNSAGNGDKADIGVSGGGHGHTRGSALEGTDYVPWGLMQADQSRQQVLRPARPFQKWIRTLQKRALRRQGVLGCDGGGSPLWPSGMSGTEEGDFDAGEDGHRRHSSSDSSFAFVTGVKSANISMAGLSLLTCSQKTTVQSSHGPRTLRSSRASLSGARHSEDSCHQERQAPVDPAVAQRALLRRHILEELISTEESYIGDVRFLMNVGLAKRSTGCCQL